MAKTPFHYNVNPRYTAGSPAMVSQDIALKVAEEERHFIEHALSGAWGPEEQHRAERDGLKAIVDERGVKRSIAEETWEHTGHWMVRDLVTGEVYERPFPDTKPARVACKRCLGARERQRVLEEV